MASFFTKGGPLMRCKPSCGRTTWSTSLCGLPHLRTLSAASYADASSRTSTRSSTTHVEHEALQVSKEFGKPFAITTTARRFVKTSQSQHTSPFAQPGEWHSPALQHSAAHSSASHRASPYRSSSSCRQERPRLQPPKVSINTAAAQPPCRF